MESTFFKRVAVLISGRGTNLQALINFTTDKSTGCPARIVLVISNKANAFGLNRAHAAGIPTKVVKQSHFPEREAFDNALTNALEAYNVNLVCLAGFMRILTPKFVQKWKGKCISIHPSLLPLFPGTKTYKQALESGAQIHGSTVHFVDEGLDTGAIILQDSIPIYPNDTELTLEARTKILEHILYPRALEAILKGQVYLDPNGNAIWKN